MSETQRKRNGGLDPRRWHQLKAERDDLPLLDAHAVTDNTTKTTTQKTPQTAPSVEGANTVNHANTCKLLTGRYLHV